MSSRFFALEERNAELRELLAADPERAQEYERRYRMSWFHHENALEGIVLTEAELSAALEQCVVGDASLMNVLTVIRNHAAALELVEQEARARRARVTLPFVVSLYETLLRGTNPSAKERAMYRKEMPLHRTYFHDIAQPDAIEAGLEAALKFTGTAEFKEYHPVRQATHVHWAVMQVFPFAEHNGKIARLLQSLYLLRGGYQPAILHGTERQRYYDSLRHPPAALRSFVLEQLENSLEFGRRFVQGGRRPQLVG